VNVILIVCDTWRRDLIGCYGNDWIRTPNVDKLARMGTVFENCYCGSFPTLPCRREIITGKYEFPWRGWGGLEWDDVTLSGLVNQSGRISYFITDVYHHWGKDAGNYWCDFSGFELIRGQERDNWITDGDIEIEYPAPEYEKGPRIKPHLRNIKLIRKNEEDWFSPRVFSTAIRWIQHNYMHKDFFLMIDSFDPHEPWDPPRYYTNLYDDPNYDGHEYVSPSYRAIEGYLTLAEFKHVQAMYAGEITMVDRWIGRFLEQVEALGLMDNTMIIITTDHGTYNGDHGQVGKLQTHMYQGISHIPMIVWHPKFGHGKRLKHLVQPIDIFPTVLEAVGLEIPDNIHGKSIIPLLRDGEKAKHRDTALFGRFCFEANLTDGEYVLYQCPDPSNPPLYSYSIIMSKWASDDWGEFDGTRRLVGPKNANTGGRMKTALFHLPSDPREEKDLSESDPEALKRMQRLLVRKFEEINAPPELITRFGLQKI